MVGADLRSILRSLQVKISAGGGRQGVNRAMLSDSVETEGCGCQESAKIEKSVSRSFHDEVIPK